MTEAQAVVAMYEKDYPEAMRCLGTDLEEVLTALRFPETHRKRIRTTNLLERLFGEGRRRAKVVPRFMTERSGLSLLFGVWRGVRVTSSANRELEVLRTNAKTRQPVRLAA